VATCSTPGLNVATDGSNHLSGFGYDAAGNMTNDGLYTYTYNAEGQQASTSAASQTYTYDGDGRRVKKSNGRTYWFSSVTGNLLVETDGSGTVLSQYIYFGGRRVARKDGSGNVTYYFEEPAGRTRTITGANGAPCNEADYYLFGGEQSHGNTCDQNYHFAGMYRDGETGNDYTQFRMYESNLGRWMTPDPLAGDISNPQSLNRYAYVLNNPMNFIDPLGLDGTPPKGTVCEPSDKNCEHPHRPACTTMDCVWKYYYGNLCHIGYTMGPCPVSKGYFETGPTISGNDIYDAMMGAPGTYLTLDIHGNVSFGFDEGLWMQTWLGFINGASHAGQSGVPTTGYVSYRVWNPLQSATIASAAENTTTSGFIESLYSTVNQTAIANYLNGTNVGVGVGIVQATDAVELTIFTTPGTIPGTGVPITSPVGIWSFPP
jgi:RHS repeat-associated protein